MQRILPTLALAASLIAGAALAQTTPAPSTERSGGPTATAGSAQQPNANPSSDPGSSAGPSSKMSMTKKKPMKPAKAPDPSTDRSGGPTATAGSAQQPYAAPK